MTRRCACCGKPFEPRPQVPSQAYCPTPACQRTRKRLWQQAKLQSDPDYRLNQRAAQQAWSQRNQGYWRNYRDARPGDAQSNGVQRHLSDALTQDQAQEVALAKMDVCDLPSGLYRITRHPDFPRENGTSWVVEITPVAPTCPRKMDMSREDLIDASSLRP